MQDFIMAALPFIIIGVCLAVFFANPRKKKSYMTEGLCFGMSLGVAAAPLFGGNMGLCLSLGMLAGVVAGMQIPKKDD